MTPEITTLEDVLERLDTGFASFEDWLDCIEVSRALGRWDIVDDCAQRALASAVGRSLSEWKLKDAARALVGGSLPSGVADGPDWLARGAARLREARELLVVRRDNSSNARVRQLLEQVLADLDAMLLLMADDEDSSRFRLASLLRKYQRPDLALSVVDRVLVSAPDDPIALNIRAAARLDLGDRRGLDDVTRADSLSSSTYTLSCLTRALRMNARLPEAMSVAERLMELEPTSWSAALLAAVAYATGDQDALVRAQELIDRLGEPADDHGSNRQVRYLAAAELLRDGQPAEAERVLTELLAERSWPKAQDLLDSVMRRRRVMDGRV